MLIHTGYFVVKKRCFLTEKLTSLVPISEKDHLFENYKFFDIYLFNSPFLISKMYRHFERKKRISQRNHNLIIFEWCTFYHKNDAICGLHKTPIRQIYEHFNSNRFYFLLKRTELILM